LLKAIKKLNLDIELKIAGSLDQTDKYKKEIAHSPFRVFTANELEEDPLVNYIDDYISNNQEGFNDEKSM
jgi:hypothetical protein